MKKITLIYLFVIPYTIYLIPNTSVALAASPRSNNYNLEIENIDTASQNVIPQKVVKNEINQVSSPLSFSVSDTFIDFGLLVSGNPSKRTATLSVANDSIGYQVQAFEDHPLQTEASTLADTTCDNGSCSEIRDSAWDNELTYGFGFTTGNYYKQFADLSRKEQPQALMTSEAKTAQIVFKANVAPGQKSDSLSNTVTFIAIPNF